MPRLPVLSGRELVKLLSKIGFRVIDQHGSHVILVKDLGSRRLKPVVPLHKELAKGTLLGILKQAEITREDLFKLLR